MSNTRVNRVLFWVCVVLGLTLDLGTKYGVEAWLSPNEPYEIIPRAFSLIHQTQQNQGALFGFGKALGSSANLFFMVVSCVVAAFILGWSLTPSVARDRVLSIALGLVLAGALGNLYDRVMFGGVRDWIWVYYRPAEGAELAFNWPVFNLADSWLVCGAGLLLLQAFFTPAAKTASGPEEVKPAANEAA